MRRVLVTGANGFIGWHTLPRLLRRGFEVHGVSRRGVTVPGVYSHAADLLDPVQVTQLLQKIRPECLLHLAWYTEHRKFWTALENYRWVSASMHLADVFVRNGGMRLVVAGTCAEYDWSQGVCDEFATALQPRTDYGVCKNALRALLDGYTRHCGVSFAWGRVFHLYGPNEHPDRYVAYIIRSLLADKPAACTAGQQRRDFLHVEDVAEAFTAILQSDVIGPINIGSGSASSLAEVATQIAKILNRPGLLELGAIPMPADEPLTLLPTVRRLHSEIGWKPTYDLPRGLTHTVNWYRNQRDTAELKS
jgi:nucleoside-diphosphate-sugar epimerase